MLVRITYVGGILALTGLWAVALYSSRPEKPAEQNPTPVRAREKPKATVLSYHAAALEAFEETPGFGRGRMIVTQKSIRDIYVHWSPGELEMDGPKIDIPGLVESHRLRSERLAKGPKQPEPDVNAIRNVDGVPAIAAKHADGRADVWNLHAVDLLALVDHPEPTVYITSKLGNAAKHGIEPDDRRGLDFFEIAGLHRLRQGDEMFVRSKDNSLRMLGALRATKSCLECHAGQVGDLFGAFSYTLARQAPQP